MTQHNEGRSWLIGRDHVASSIHKHEPEVACNLRPAHNFLADGPDLFGSSLPHVDVFPLEAVDVLQYTWSVDDHIILAIVDQSLNPPNNFNNIVGDTPSDILAKSSVDLIVPSHINDLWSNSEDCFVLFQHISEGVITVVVIPEVEYANASHVGLWGCVIVGDKVEVVSRLRLKTKITFWKSPSYILMMLLVWNQEHVSRKPLSITPTDHKYVS